MHEILKQIHWRDHLLTLWQFGVSLILMLAATYFFLDRQSLLAEKVRSHDSVQFMAVQAAANEQLLHQHLDDYYRFVDAGYIGKPRRLQWIEALKKIGDRNDLPVVEFTLDRSYVTQQHVDPFWHAEVPTLATDMTLVLQLSHEGDFYRLLEGLDQEAEGMFSVEACNLRWLESADEELALTRFRGTCQLRWYTLIDRTDYSIGET